MKEHKKNNKGEKIAILSLIVLMIMSFAMLFYMSIIKVDGIKVKCDAENMYIGETKQLEYELLFNKPVVSEEKKAELLTETPVEWFTSNDDIATIDENGLVTAVSKGRVVIGAMCGDIGNSFVMEILVPVEEIVVNEISVNTINNKGTLYYECLPVDAYIKNITTEVIDPTIITLEGSNITGLKAGETAIRITADNISAELPVKVKQATESISAGNLSIFAGSGAQLKVVAKPANAEAGLKFKYKSANESIAKVSESGWVSAVGKGSTTITITNEFGQSCESTITVTGFPLTYSDGTSNITIYKEWYGNAWVYAAHITFSDYSRLGTACGRNTYGGKETTSSAAARQGAILCINGCYSAPYLNYATARSGVVMQDGKCYSPGVYSKHNGLLLSAWEVGGTPGYVGAQLSSLVASGAVTDTFTFGPPILSGGAIKAGSGGGRAQRTFIGTNGAPGDIWLCVSDGRKNDGVSAGLTYTECAQYLQSKGCTLGIPLDGGGSSTMVFRGNVLNAARGNQRAVVDFVYFR